MDKGIQKIHLIAVCGTGMGALACMLQELGFTVTGSDHKVYPPMSTFLESKGIKIFDGFSSENIAYNKPDLVIVGNAIRKDNPEVLKTKEMGINFCSMPQALNAFIAVDKKPILITGTHGKTTTSSLFAWMLYKANLDPTFFIGGILKNFNSNYRLGKGKYIVIEGDEYDTAFFDKGPKFLHYNPDITIITSIEFDHADIYSNIDSIKAAFKSLVSKLPKDKIILGFDSDSNISEILKNNESKIFFYGKDNESDWRIDNIKINNTWTLFEVFRNKESLGTFKSKMMGEHNILNALSVIAGCYNLNISVDIIKSALETFEGVKRRQEIRGVVNEITVMDDFAHHPTAVRETIKAVKPFYNQGRLIAVFEPRTNSSMRNIFQDVYPLSFDGADIICIRKPPLLEKIPINERISSENMVINMQNIGKKAFHFDDTDSIIEFLSTQAKPNDVILIMSNGGFDNIHQRLIERLS
ncbi:MAG: UDP-N-acetylmuramate:L-alanyl-gamma-D-glutamyl-meso-diaminopimelate ligase [Desulfobacterales bacterium]|nr:UDP-N-acetylmuramate:L-alanyl-gamma-D-glutamyl-meso-diaminopimelate ligase [Desulfobacterales bacterium]